MNIFRWISAPRDRRRREEPRYRRNYHIDPLYRYSPRSWAEALPRVTTNEDNPRIVFVSPDPDTMTDHRRHHRRRRHERAESLTPEIPRHSPYIPSYTWPTYTDSRYYTPLYPTRHLYRNPTDYPTSLDINNTSAYDLNVQRDIESSYASAEPDHDRRRTREINRLTQDLQRDNSEDAQRERARERRRRHERSLEGNSLSTEPDDQARNHDRQRAIRDRIAELEASIRERELRRERRAGRHDSTTYSENMSTRPASLSRDLTPSYSYSGGYLRPRVRFSPTASCYGEYNPRGGYESSGSEEVYYGGWGH